MHTMRANEICYRTHRNIEVILLKKLCNHRKNICNTRTKTTENLFVVSAFFCGQNAIYYRNIIDNFVAKVLLLINFIPFEKRFTCKDFIGGILKIKNKRLSFLAASNHRRVIRKRGTRRKN